jgi:hypothetical protein
MIQPPRFLKKYAFYCMNMQHDGSGGSAGLMSLLTLVGTKIMNARLMVARLPGYVGTR